MTSSPAADPSTEQILASIRQSIADIAGEGRTRPPAAQAAEADPRRGVAGAEATRPVSASDGVVALRPRQGEPDKPAAAPARPEQMSEPEPKGGVEGPQPRYNYTLRREAPPAGPRQADQRAAAQPMTGPRSSTREVGPTEAPILSAEADASVTRAFSGLANTLLSNEARTLEDLVREMLRPMLKTWLDTNLPPLVERLVREEIERVARGQRGS